MHRLEASSFLVQTKHQNMSAHGWHWPLKSARDDYTGVQVQAQRSQQVEAVASALLRGLLLVAVLQSVRLQHGCVITLSPAMRI